MSIATELQNLNDNILDAYTAVQGKGGTVPANKNMTNLPTAISSISGGGSFVGIPREVNANGVYGFPAQNFSFSLPSDATGIDPYVLSYAFQHCTSLTSVDLRPLTTADQQSVNYAFQYCYNLASVNLSSLTTVSGYNAFSYAFRNCTSLTSVSFDSLVTVSGGYAFSYAFSYCSNIASINFDSLTTVSGSSAFANTFRSCTSLASVSFPALSTVSGDSAFGYTFQGCTGLTTLSFPSLTASSFGSSNNQFNNMLLGCSGVTVHFPAAIQSTIGSWTSVTRGFSGTNTTVLFDL